MVPPGAVARSDELRTRLEAALLARGSGYVPRTRHAEADGTPRYTNRLILESSPYLTQHAHNPVDWFAWGDEAFEQARRLGRPVFLSVGYSTCHWCHVMEEESFEDAEIARYLNAHYVCIKVDREERPDIDASYMAFVQALTGRGGWPMSVWLTPSREPFFGGTYFPPRAGARGGGPGFLELLTAQADRFLSDPSQLIEAAQSMTERLRAASAPRPTGALPGAEVIEAARAAAARRFDPEAGGLAGAPKFPSSFPVRLLLRVARRSAVPDARAMALATLEHMRAGGMYDQIGGGFHRYSTDAAWRVPHFEKMLYDNALLALAYVEAAQVTGSARDVRTVREVLDYLLRDMSAADGGFYSATDADSLAASGRREEGVFFTWTPEELTQALGADAARVAGAWFGVTPQGQLDGRSVLSTARSRQEVAGELGLSPTALDEQLAGITTTLLARRATRPPPARDEKVIVAWNALAVSAFARAAITLGERRYADAAVRGAALLTTPRESGAPLPHLFVAGQPKGRAFADDAVLLAAALLDVFELTADVSWLASATALMESVERDFSDTRRGGYFATSADHESLLLREKPAFDGPTPSVNSAAALVWLRLYDLTDEARYRARAEATLRAFAQTLTEHPLELDQMLLALDWATDMSHEIAIILPEGRGALAPGARPWLDALSRRFVPNSVLVIASEADIAGELGQRVPWLAEKKAHRGRATAYVCERGVCQLPTSDPEVFTRQLGRTEPYPKRAELPARP